MNTTTVLFCVVQNLANSFAILGNHITNDNAGSFGMGINSRLWRQFYVTRYVTLGRMVNHAVSPFLHL